MADPRVHGAGESTQFSPATQQNPDTGPSLGQLVGDLIADAQLLARREFDLARTEIMGEVNKVRQGATLLGAGMAVTALGGLFLVAMVAELLVEVGGLNRWLAYLIVGAVLAVAGGIVLAVGVQRFKTVDPVPRETIASVREDLTWLKEQSPSERT
ncbi:MAG: hypothetical protein OHK0015_00980 [Chloroflexi bacterium OHK40]